MGITVTTGSNVQIASTYGSQFTVTAITNANPAVATLSAAHGVVVGDYIELTSGWDRLNRRVVRVSAVATNDVTLEGINTSSTSIYPAGAGTGTGREITAWTTITQVKSINSSGGEQQFADVTTIADDEQRQFPTVRSAVSYNLEVLSDDSLGWVTTVDAADAARTPYAFRVNFSNGSRFIMNAYWARMKNESIAAGDVLKHTINVTAAASPIRYAT